jgi:hypothetical protein
MVVRMAMDLTVLLSWWRQNVKHLTSMVENTSFCTHRVARDDVDVGIVVITGSGYVGVEVAVSNVCDYKNTLYDLSRE